MAYLTQNVTVAKKTFSLTESKTSGPYTSSILDCSSAPVSDVCVTFYGVFTVSVGTHTPVIQVSADGSNWVSLPHQGFNYNYGSPQLNGNTSGLAHLLKTNGTTYSTNTTMGLNVPGHKDIFKFVRVVQSGSLTMTGTITYTILAK